MITKPETCNQRVGLHFFATTLDRVCECGKTANLARFSGSPTSEDTKRLDWLTEHAYQLSTTGEGESCDGRWDVFPNALELDEDTDTPNGRTPREAIDAAMAASRLVEPSTQEPAKHD